MIYYILIVLNQVYTHKNMKLNNIKASININFLIFLTERSFKDLTIIDLNFLNMFKFF